MADLIGQTLAHYRVTAALGAGGMGEVYRATDGKLGREVAIKVLPPEVAQDPERLDRFQREAQVLASLNHPNLGAIYGLEEAEGRIFLVLELVEGEELKERIERGAIPTDEAVEIAGQIAEGLEEAHERGIVHRDLKPANVKLTPDGKVKVLDFGLARAWTGDPATGSSSDLSQSPTLAHSSTQAGVILGTAAYMAPEQARGRPVDKRADVWAFGVVLFEMLTGQRLFEGETVSDVLASVLKTEPDWGKLPRSTPAPVRRLLRRCLVRDPRGRLRDMGDARLELTAGAADEEVSASPPPARFASRPAIGVMIALGLAALALGLLPTLRDAGPAGIPGAVRTSIALPHGHALVAGPEITRDGQRVAFVSTDGSSRPELYTRRLDEDELQRLEGTEEADQPFFSPDGRWIAFYARGGLFKVHVDGSEPVRLADAGSSSGGHWLEDDTILFTPTWNSGLYRIDGSGGEPVPFLVPEDRVSHYAYTWPFVLPSGRAMLFSRWGAGKPDLARLDLDDGSVSVVDDRQWRRSFYTASGHIVVLGDGGDLLALPGDAPAATPETVLTNVADGSDPTGYMHASVSSSGTLVYSPLDTAKRSLVLVDPAGNLEPVQGRRANYVELSVSPDGGHAVVTSDMTLLVHDLSRGSVRPLAPELREKWRAHWTADGSRIVFASNQEGNWDIYSKAASGAGTAELLLDRPFDMDPTSVMRDGTVVFEESHPETASDIWLLPPGGEPQPWLVTPTAEKQGRASPDDRLMAFISFLSGRYEVYVQPIDRSTQAVPVSTRGGTGPVWSRSGDRLFFRQGRLLMAAPVVSRPRLEVGTPEVVFDGGWELAQDTTASYVVVNYDTLPDGRFLMVRNDPTALQTRINVIFNWFEELNRLVPLGR